MRNSVFATIVYGRTVCNVQFVFLQPIGYRSTFLFYSSAKYSNVTPVVNNMMPFVFELLAGFHIFCINQQTRCLTVEAVNHVCGTFLSRTFEIVIEYCLYIQRRLSDAHRKNAVAFLYHHQISVFVNQFYVLTLKLVVLFACADRYFIAFMQSKIKLCYDSVIDFNTTILKCCLCFRLALLYVFQQPLQQRSIALHVHLNVLFLFLI